VLSRLGMIPRFARMVALVDVSSLASGYWPSFAVEEKVDRGLVSTIL
jgi:hypothetical protein